MQEMSQGLKLRDYQAHGIELAREAMRLYKRLIYYLPTGGGKTEVAVALIQSAVSNGKRVAFICNRNQLINQTVRKFMQRGIHCGILQGENTHSEWSQVMVCSIQTIRSRNKNLRADLIIVDEAHQCAGTKHFLEIFKGARVIGLTATPYQKGLGKRYKELDGPLFEHVCIAATISELVDKKWLVPAEVWGPPIDLTGVKVTAGEYQEDSLAEAVDKPGLIGDIVTQWLKLAEGKQTMVFAVNIAHSKHICESFRSIGVNAVHVDYKMTETEKEAIYERFRNKEIDVLCNCALLSEGADFPAAECLVLARPTKSRVRFVQMIGRVLRPSDGKERAIILDHGSCYARLGWPEEYDVSKLDDGSPKKSSSKDKDEKPIPLPKPCPKCHFLRPAKVHVCPSCGFVPERKSEVNHTEDDLEQLSKGPSKIKLSVKLAAMPKQEVYSQLLGHCREKGYKPGWAANQYKKIFGVWPRGMHEISSPVQAEVQIWLRQQQIAWAKSNARYR